MSDAGPSETDAPSAAPAPLVDDAFLARMATASFHPYVVLAADGTIRYVGTSVIDLLGAPAEQYIGRNMLDVLHPDSRDRVINAFSEFTEPNRPHTGWVGPALTVHLIDVAGQRVPCRVLAVPSGDPDFDGLVLTIRRTESNRKLDMAIASLVQGAEIETTLRLILDFASEQMPYSAGVLGLGFADGAFQSIVSDPRALLDSDDDPLPVGPEPTPWGLVLDGAADASMETADLPEPIRSRATRAGLPACWAYSLNFGPPHRDVLVYWRRAGGPPGPHLAEATQRIIGLIQLALDADRTRRLLEQQAHTDELTGLANRTSLIQHLEQIRDDPPSEPFGILYCDLDDFKPINDQLGHLLGDRVLEIAAQRIERHVRAEDLAVRIGGDEFAVLCPGTTSDDLELLASRLVEAFNQPISIDGHELDLGISIGAAVLDPNTTAVDPERVLARADAALLHAKAAGKGRWHASESAT